MTITDLTKNVIAKMLKENTGMSVLDSGSAYGRNWQRNQVREFNKENPVTLSIDKYGIDYTRNIYHFLTDNLEYEKGLTNSLYSFESKYENKYAYWPEIVSAWFKKKGYLKVHGDNIYNQENNLSQVFQYDVFSLDGKPLDDIYQWEYIILQIHGGCDVRGGYTDPKVFRIVNDSFWMIADGSIGCSNGHGWYTDDDYHWYPNNDEITHLDQYERVSLEEYQESEEYQDIVNKQIIVPDNQLYLFPDYQPVVINPITPPPGKLYYDENNNGYCPICGSVLVG